MVTIKREMDDVEFWSNIMGADWEGFGDHWQAVEYLDGAEWDVPGTVRLTIEDPAKEDESLSMDVTLADLVKAYETLLVTKGMHADYLDLDNLDCVGSDGILQQAVLGSVVYG